MHCYCLKRLYKVQLGILDEKFPNGEEYCQTWFEAYTLSNSLVYLIAFGITVLNIIAKTVVKCTISSLSYI